MREDRARWRTSEQGAGAALCCLADGRAGLWAGAQARAGDLSKNIA